MSSLDPARIFATLDRHGVDYVTIGAFAVIAHGYVRATADIDLIVGIDEDNAVRLASALRELHARLRGVDAHLLDIDATDPGTLRNGASFTLDTDAGPLDLLNDVPGAGDYADLRARAIETTAAGVVVRVVALDDLLRMKRASGRPQDLTDIANLTASQTEPPDGID
jgi:predicted nucleotidyltransferase